MLFPSVPQSAAQIRGFCERFNEGIRVEYKSAFDERVRKALPKVVSSFANSLGGVLIVGVVAPNGVVQTPIEGFLKPSEELPLTVEGICIQGINPPLFPRTTVVDSDIPGSAFLVIEVDEIWEAPHAIENSKKVYVRTGNAANLSRLSWKWRKRSSVKITERTYEERTKALQRRREGSHLETAPFGQSASFRPV